MSSMSKRAQARTERELQEILTQPGNSTCADCGARNPGWASWSIGVFLCMRCAALHRKMGTHISKVKSLTMDTWTNEQVENMRKNGNSAVNKVYNPRNKKPDTPLDADEVDNAIERFIRKKYQERSLSDGRPEVPSRDPPAQSQPRSPESATSPTLPNKKKGFWTGFGLRASSSAYPLSKHDRKHRDEPKVESAFRITSEDHTAIPTRKPSPPTDVSESDLKQKLVQLRDMGFTDVERNTQLLKKARGDVERVIAALIKLGPTEKEVREKKRAEATKKKKVEATKATTASSQPATAPRAVSLQKPVPEPIAATMNPFDALDQIPTPSGAMVSAHQQPQQQSQPQPQPQPQQQLQQQQQQPSLTNTNPWQAALPVQPNTGLEQAFAGMQVSPQRPLFPHNTGGYAMQQPTSMMYQSQAPPTPQYYSATSSPITSNNPFLQQTSLSAHSTGSNVYASQVTGVPNFAPSTNPFLSDQFPPSQQPSSSFSNPFGLPPTREPQQQPQQSMFDAPIATQGHSTTSSPGFPNFQYGQPQSMVSGNQQQPQQSFASSPTSYNLFQPPLQQFSPQLSPQPSLQPSQQQPMVSQQTGRYDKASILAMYNYPQFAPQKSLASIPEPVETTSLQQALQPLSPAPAAEIYSQTNNFMVGKRASTMPVSSINPSSQSPPPSRNPFFNNTNTSSMAYNAYGSVHSSPGMSQFSIAPQQLQSANPYYPQGSARHASADSMAVNNPTLMNGRHSPDVWGGLSSRT